MNKFIKTLSVFLLVATISFVSAQQKEVDDTKKGGAKKSITKDDIKKNAVVKGGMLKLKKHLKNKQAMKLVGQAIKAITKKKVKAWSQKETFSNVFLVEVRKKRKKRTIPNN